MTERTSPDSGITTYRYDPAGNLTGKTDARGAEVNYQYDALNRPTQASLTLGAVDVLV